MDGDAAVGSGPWRFAQCFGDKGEVEDITEGAYWSMMSTSILTFHLCPADIISTVEFDHTGDYLATGDKGGRVVLFERNSQVSRVEPVVGFSIPVCCTRRAGIVDIFNTWDVKS